MLVAAGLVYVLAGVVAGHFHRHFIGGRGALSPAALGRDLLEHLRWMKSERKAIEAIKLIREHTGLGLKEAKDLYDQL